MSIFSQLGTSTRWDTVLAMLSKRRLLLTVERERERERERGRERGVKNLNCNRSLDYLRCLEYQQSAVNDWREAGSYSNIVLSQSIRLNNVG